jgi:hypothetical protein
MTLATSLASPPTASLLGHARNEFLGDRHREQYGGFLMRHIEGGRHE